MAATRAGQPRLARAWRRLEFVDPAEMRRDMCERPVYLGREMTTQGRLKLEPQNLLLKLPLAAPS
jgi:hypothetical protein